MTSLDSSGSVRPACFKPGLPDLNSPVTCTDNPHAQDNYNQNRIVRERGRQVMRRVEQEHDVIGIFYYTQEGTAGNTSGEPSYGPGREPDCPKPAETLVELALAYTMIRIHLKIGPRRVAEAKADTREQGRELALAYMWQIYMKTGPKMDTKAIAGTAQTHCVTLRSNGNILRSREVVNVLNRRTARSVENETRNAELNCDRNPECWGDFHQLIEIEKIKYLGISRYKVKLRFGLDLNSEVSRGTNSN